MRVSSIRQEHVVIDIRRAPSATRPAGEDHDEAWAPPIAADPASSRKAVAARPHGGTPPSPRLAMAHSSLRQIPSPGHQFGPTAPAVQYEGEMYELYLCGRISGTRLRQPCSSPPAGFAQGGQSSGGLGAVRQRGAVSSIARSGARSRARPSLGEQGARQGRLLLVARTLNRQIDGAGGARDAGRAQSMACRQAIAWVPTPAAGRDGAPTLTLGKRSRDQRPCVGSDAVGRSRSRRAGLIIARPTIRVADREAQRVREPAHGRRRASSMRVVTVE